MIISGPTLVIKLDSGNLFKIFIEYTRDYNVKSEIRYSVIVYNTGNELINNKLYTDRLDNLCLYFHNGEVCYEFVNGKKVPDANCQDSQDWLEIAPNSMEEILNTINFYNT